MAMKSPLAELTLLAGERQANSDFWAVGSAELVGPQAVSEGVKRFSLMVSIRNNFMSDMALEFNGETGASALRMWQTPLSASTLEDNVVHVRMSIEADEAPRQVGQIAASPLGQRLAAVVKAAQYLPVRVTPAPRQARPVISGLDGPNK